MPILDIFRLVGAICVFFVHAHTSYEIKTPLANYGTQWLTWFFMLSGFVLTLKYFDTNWGADNLKKFIINRSIRILPVYIISVIFSSVILIVGLEIWGWKYFTEVSGRIQMYTFPLPNKIDNSCVIENAISHLLLIQTFIGDKLCGGAFLINPPLWSAAIEFWIYLCFPLVIVMSKNLTNKNYISAIIVSLIIIDYQLVGIFIENDKVNSWQDVVWPIHFNPAIRLLEFALGTLIGRHYLVLKDRKYFIADKSIIILLLITSCWGVILWINVEYTIAYWLSATGLPWVLIILYFMIQANNLIESKRGVFSNRCAVLSYSLYCVHWCSIELFSLLGMKKYMSINYGKWEAIIACLLFTLFIANAFVILENKIVRKIK